MRGRRDRSAATLAEILIAVAVLALFSLALLGTLAQTISLSQKDGDITRATASSRLVMEHFLTKAKTREGYTNLASCGRPLPVAADPGFVYACDIVPCGPAGDTDGLKRIAVHTYFADPSNPTQVDPGRPRQGLALTLSAQVCIP
jgi:type II secretory pathway pseudopilin PulG